MGFHPSSTDVTSFVPLSRNDLINLVDAAGGTSRYGAGRVGCHDIDFADAILTEGQEVSGSTPASFIMVSAGFRRPGRASGVLG